VAEQVRQRVFVVSPSGASVSSPSIKNDTNPTATAGGTTAKTTGSVTVTGTGTGAVAAALYGSNPAGPPAFAASGGYAGVYVGVGASGSAVSSLTVNDCNLNDGTKVYWWNGNAWAPIANQTYDSSAQCATFTLNSGTSPELTGAPIAAGSPPSITSDAATADGRHYFAGTWTNQSVTVTFTCSENAKPTPATVTRASDGKDQTAEATCTDGVGQKTVEKFTDIDVDKTPPTCTVSVIASDKLKPGALSGQVTAGDNLSGVGSVVDGPVTSKQALAAGEVQGFDFNTTYDDPLKLSAVVDFTGELKPPSGGRLYQQTVTVKDQAGNTNTTPCTWAHSVR
jgi:hypothetical protein